MYRVSVQNERKTETQYMKRWGLRTVTQLLPLEVWLLLRAAA